MPARVALVVAAVLALAACSRPADPPAPAAANQAPAAPVAGIAWQQAATDAEVDAAFARARAERKPVFLYWGAKWCPPCNQLQATLFNRNDFIERSRAFVPVYIDGDRPGAQKLGTRFKVRGYPTMVLFNADGAETTRLPGEVDAAAYNEVLTLGMNAQRPAKAVLADARAGGGGLSPNDWKLLAFYSWETDEQQLVPKGEAPAVLKQLAANCPPSERDSATRLLLKSVVAADGASAAPDAATRGRVLQLLADPAASRTQMDVLAYGAADLVKALSAPATAERQALLAAFDGAMRRLQADTTLSRADRLNALVARVDLARIDLPKGAPPTLPAPLLAEVRAHAAAADREITDGYERQAVVTGAGYLLQLAGLGAESDTLLEANLPKSHSPYYLMSQLASNAKQRGDKDAALRWSAEAYAKAEGPATRLQWGASYVGALVELAPQDEARIEQAVGQLFDEAAAQPNAFYERSARALQRVGERLAAWNKDRSHAVAMQRLQGRLDAICAKLPIGDPQRATCESLLKPPAGGARAAA